MSTKIKRDIRLIQEKVQPMKNHLKKQNQSLDLKKLRYPPECKKEKNLNGMCLEQNLENRMSQDMSSRVQNRNSDFDC